MLKDAIELIQTVIADLQTPLAAGTATYRTLAISPRMAFHYYSQIPLTRLARGLKSDARGDIGDATWNHGGRIKSTEQTGE